MARAAGLLHPLLEKGWAAVVSAPRTPAATLLIRQFQSESAAWDDITTTDAPSIQRQRAEARRDAIDWAIAQLRVALPVIEDEAEQDERDAFAWLEAGAGVPA